MGRRIVVVVLGALLAVAWSASGALAGSPGVWEKVGADVGSSLPLAGVLRTSDDVLHVVWRKDVAGGDEQYLHVAISKGGIVGSSTPILSSAWPAVNEDPKLVADGSGIQLMFSGLDGSLSSGYFYRSTSATGSSWTAPAKVGQWNYAYGVYGLGAAEFANGTPIVGGALNSDVYWHVGTNPSDADGTFHRNGTSFIKGNVAVDRGTDEAWYVWYDLDKYGVYALPISPTLGSVAKGPSSTPGGQSLIPGQQLPLVAVPGGGLYTAYCTTYPSCTKAVVWEVGTTRTVPFNVSDGTDMISLGTGGGGKIWIVTHDNYSGAFYASRSNKAVTKFGSVRKFAPPAKSVDAYGITVDGSTGRADVVANVLASDGTNNLWHTQVLAGLTLAASPTKWDGGSSKTVVFTVRDAGAAVSGAAVKVGTKSCTTGTKGTCSIGFAKMAPTKLRATATKAGYAKDTVTLTVT